MTQFKRLHRPCSAALYGIPRENNGRKGIAEQFGPLTFPIIAPFALCPLPFALCPFPFSFPSLPFALCPLPFSFPPSQRHWQRQSKGARVVGASRQRLKQRGKPHCSLWRWRGSDRVNACGALPTMTTPRAHRSGGSPATLAPAIVATLGLFIAVVYSPRPLAATTVQPTTTSLPSIELARDQYIQQHKALVDAGQLDAAVAVTNEYLARDSSDLRALLASASQLWAASSTQGYQLIIAYLTPVFERAHIAPVSRLTYV